MKTRLGWIGLLLSGVLVACPQPPQAVTPTPQTPTPTPVAFKPKLLGSVVIDFDSAAKTAKVKFDHVQTRVTNFPAETDLKFTGNNFTVLDQGANRFISAGFQVQNLSLTTDFNNLTLVAYHRRSVVGSENTSASAFFNVQNFGGAFNPDVLQFRPAHGMTTSAGNVVVDNGHADLQVFSPSEITTLETDAATGSLINAGAISGEAVLGYGYVARNATNGRTIVKNTSDSSLTVGLKVPVSSDPGTNAYRYSMTFLIFTDNVTRVTESLEEQAASGATARATPLAATVAYLCGSSLTGGTFIPGAKTAGATNATAYMGGNLKITSTAAYGYVATGNTPKTVAVANTLLSHYASLDGVATPTATTGLAAGTGGVATTVNADGSFVFTPTVGVTGAKTFSYRVSDGGSCTTPDQSADVNITNMVWYVKNNVAGAGTGHFNDPFKTLASASGASSAGEYIFVYNGANNTSNQNAGITLKANQKLVGEGDDLIIAGDTIVAAGSKAKIGNSGGTGVVLAPGNEIRGLDITGTSAGITGSGFGTATISKTSVMASAGAALDLSTGVMAISLDKITASGGTNNLKLTSNTGTFVVNGDGVTAGSGGTLQGSSADGVLLSDPGDVTLKFVNITNAGTHGINLTSSSGTQKLSLQKTKIQGSGAAVGTLGDGINFAGNGGTTTLAISGSSFIGNEQNGMFLTTPTASNAILNLSVLASSLFQTNGGAGLSVPLFGTGSATLDVQNNSFQSDVGNSINMSAESTSAAAGTVQARIKTNTITLASTSSGNGVEIASRNVGKMVLDVSSNTISNFPTIGIRMLASGTNSKIDATVQSNTVTPATTTLTVIPLQGMFFASGTAAGTTSTMCLNLNGNNSTPGSGSPNDGYRVRQRLNTTFQLQGYVGAPNSTAVVQSFITGQNTGTATAQAASTTITVNYTSATCATPSF